MNKHRIWICYRNLTRTLKIRWNSASFLFWQKQISYVAAFNKVRHIYPYLKINLTLNFWMWTSSSTCYFFSLNTFTVWVIIRLFSCKAAFMAIREIPVAIIFTLPLQLQLSICPLEYLSQTNTAYSVFFYDGPIFGIFLKTMYIVCLNLCYLHKTVLNK